ncbi:S-layer homology domain-containing protein [Caldinitratiruptor microaerophilus]|uniref:SLH domain-containing protein n=1 Tax=Caldinitratiruptor microaerophilus TaxID=671077 RepID=A0AA35CJ38_9FIRM|nr:S-layer homology domain-containing protein [Caldinitratiruptor microaerophilus]BDG60209.1 hypothetical protein caldi_12990 [Caldinitratiruptor microaerophilus]
MKRWTAWLLAAVIALAAGPSASAAPKAAPGKGKVRVVLEFNDVESAQWALQYITRMQVKAIFRGYEDGTFRPNAPIRRIEAVVTAVRLMGLEEEARSRTGVQLNFRDAEKVYREYPWAVGYVAVALEKGLFDSTEDQLQPDREASRLWIATLLVRALGLQQEALSRMNEPLPFKDAAAIPAGAVGYIAVAAEKGIVAGYPDGTFKPHKPVTRAEMAALLDRTDQQMPAPGEDQEEIQGTLLSAGTELEIQTVSGDVYSVPVTSATRVFIGGKVASVDQLESGLWVEVDLDEDGNALLVVARAPQKEEAGVEVKGVITAIVPPGGDKGPQVTIEADDGEATYEIAETARIEIEGVKDPTWEDLRVGDRVQAEGAGDVLTKIEVEDREEAEKIEVEGVVTAIVPPGGDKGPQVTIEADDGEATYEIAETARIEIEGVKDPTWEDLRVGDRVQAEGAGDVLTKVKVEDRGEGEKEQEIGVKGVITAIEPPDGDKGALVTIETEDGEETYEIAAGARIEIKGVRSATWEDLKVGDRVEAEGRGGVLTKIKVEGPKGGKGRGNEEA